MPVKIIKTESLRERYLDAFMAKVVKSPSGCWQWQGGTTSRYGVFHCYNKKFLAHRISYAMFNGEVPTNRLVMHQCNNPSCVNPLHLQLGTAKDNALFKVATGRHHHKSKTHCIRGHLLNTHGVWFGKDGSRICKQCSALRQRARRSGHPVSAAMQDPLKRLYHRVIVDETTECHLVSGKLHPSGYVQISVNQKPIRAHVYAYIRANALTQMPHGMVVRHAERCAGRRNCINPEHLCIGTYKDNNIDTVLHGHHAGLRKTHCKHGHLLPERKEHQKQRVCTQCALIRTRKHHLKKKNARITIIQTHCALGHEFTDENTYYRKERPGKYCCECRRTKKRIWQSQRSTLS